MRITARRRRPRAGNILLCLALVLGVCRVATAQKLELDNPPGIKAGSEKSLEHLITKLREEARERESKVGAADADAATTLTSQARLRQFTASLLSAGTALGRPGSVHVLTARRLAARLGELDPLLQILATSQSDASRQAVQTFLAACPADVKAMPRTPAELDALLAAGFAQLARSPGTATPTSTSGWLIVGLDPARSTPAELDQVLEQCSRTSGVSRAASDSLRNFAVELARDDRAGAPLERSAAQRQLLILAAQPLLHPPRWLTPKATTAITALFDSAARQFDTREGRAAARLDLCRLALLADVSRRLDATRFPARPARSLRTLAAQLAEQLAPADTSNDDVLLGLRRGLQLLEAGDDAKWEDSRRLVRDARPAWTSVELRARQARTELIETLTRLTPKTPALSDPAFLAATGALRDTLDDGRRLCVISEWLAGHPDPARAGAAVWMPTPPKASDPKPKEPVAERDRLHRQAAERLLTLGQRLGKPEPDAAAFMPARELADALSAWMPIPGEAAMRAAAAAPDSPEGKRWSDLTNGSVSDLVRAVDLAREIWLQSWAGIQEKPAKGARPEPARDTDRIQILQRLVTTLADAATVLELSDSAPAAGIRAWPGFEVSPAALEAVLSPVRSELTRASGFVIAGDYTGLEQLLSGMGEHVTVVGALAAMDRAAREARVARAAAIEELGDPPLPLPTLADDLVPRTWQLELRDPCAALCRWMEEFADASTAGDHDRALPFLKQMLAESQAIQQYLGRQAAR